MTTQQNIKNLVQHVKTYLNSWQMLAYESWISGCVEHFISIGYTTEQIENSAYEQWLLNELKYISPGSLPEKLDKQKNTELYGKHVLQINSVLDISIPLYQQYLKMKKADTQNIEATMNPEDKISSKRMLKFELTDGKQTIHGMEYETITNLKTEDIIPGCKVLIMGPVRCRQGILLLTGKNIKFLGGEVKEMLKTHSLAAQLARMLKLPTIENGALESTKIPIVNGDNLDGGCDGTAGQRKVKTETSRQNNNSYKKNHHSNQTTTSESPEIPGVNNDESPYKNSIEELYGKRQLETEEAPEKKMKLDEEYIGEDDLRAIEECERLYSSNFPITISSEPFVYIKQINELSSIEKRGKVFKVKAQIQNVLTKLQMVNREWNLKCTIIDGSGCMDVEFSSEILSSFLGYTPENIGELKKKVAANPEIKNNINLAYVKTAETLRTLYCIMELTMNTLPKITRIIDFDHSHIESLEQRLNNVDMLLKIG